MAMSAIPQGTRPETVVSGMDLIHFKAEYKTNTKPVHWSSVKMQDIGSEFNMLPGKLREVLESDPNTLAIWCDWDKMVFAWVD